MDFIVFFTSYVIKANSNWTFFWFILWFNVICGCPMKYIKMTHDLNHECVHTPYSNIIQCDYIAFVVDQILIIIVLSYYVL